MLIFSVELDLLVVYRAWPSTIGIKSLVFHVEQVCTNQHIHFRLHNHWDIYRIVEVACASIITLSGLGRANGSVFVYVHSVIIKVPGFGSLPSHQTYTSVFIHYAINIAPSWSGNVTKYRAHIKCCILVFVLCNSIAEIWLKTSA